MPRSAGGSTARRSAGGATGSGGGRKGGRVVALAAVLLLLCSIVGGSFATILVDRSSEGEPVEPAAEQPTGEFEETLRAAVAADPRNVTAVASLANVLADAGELPEAIDRYEEALALDPGNAAIRFDFASTLAGAGRRADAELQFRRAIEADPGRVEAQFYLAELYQNWQPPRPADAIAHYRRVVEMAPDAYLSDRAREELDRLAGVAASPAATPLESGTVTTETEEDDR